MEATLIQETIIEPQKAPADSNSAESISENLRKTILAETDLPPGCTEPHLVQTHQLSDFMEQALRHPTIRTDNSLYRRIQVALSCSCELREHVASTDGSEEVKVKLVPISALLAIYKELHPQCTCDISILRHILQPIDHNSNESSDDTVTNQELECENCASSFLPEEDEQPKPLMKELARQKLRDIVGGSALVNPIAPSYTASAAFKASLERLRHVLENENYEASVGDLRGAPTLRATSLKDIKWERAAVPTGPSPHLFPGHKVPEEVKLAQPKPSGVRRRREAQERLVPRDGRAAGDSFAAEMRVADRQLTALLNGVLTAVGVFAFVVFAPYYAGLNIALPTRLVAATFIAFGVLLIEIYFIAKYLLD